MCCSIIILTTVNQVRFRTRSDIVFLIFIFSRVFDTRGDGQSGLHPGQNVAPPSSGLLFIVHPVEGQSGLHPSQNVSSSIFPLTRAVIPRLKVNSSFEYCWNSRWGYSHLVPMIELGWFEVSHVTSRSPPSPVACMDWVWFGFEGTVVLHACTIVTMISIFVLYECFMLSRSATYAVLGQGLNAIYPYHVVFCCLFLTSSSPSKAAVGWLLVFILFTLSHWRNETRIIPVCTERIGVRVLRCGFSNY